MTRQPQSIRDLHNTCSGRVFILGNGPSIRDQLPLLHKLRGEATFGCNTLLSWKELPFTPTYYGVTDINDASVLNRVVYPEAEGRGDIWVQHPPLVEGVAVYTHVLRGNRHQ